MPIRIVVTGASGLVGRAVMDLAPTFEGVLELIPVATADADLTDYAATLALFRSLGARRTPTGETNPIHGVIHLAARVGGLFRNMNEPVEMTQDNTLMNINVLKAAHELGIDNVLMCLSTCVFPDRVDAYPITAADLHKGAPHPSNEGYAYAKRLCDTLTRAYQRQYGRRYFCVVPTNVYGRHDNFDLANAHVVPALIHKCWKAKRDGAPFVVAGTGTPLRQFIYAPDLARLILWAYVHYEYEKINEPLFLCPPNSEVPIRDVVGAIARAFDYEHAVVYDTTLPDGQFKKTAAAFPAEHEADAIGAGWTPLAQGLAETVAWFRAAVDGGGAAGGAQGALRGVAL